MNKKRQALLKELPTLGSWHHIIDLGNGISTNGTEHSGYDPEMRWQIIEKHLPEDLSGASVLDLGCNSGYLAMNMKKRGAKRVVAVYTAPLILKQAEFIMKWYDVNVELVHRDVHTYCLTTEERFDYVIFLGIFYHLKYPVIVLDRLAEMTKSLLFFQTVKIGGQESYQLQENYEIDEMRTMYENPSIPKMMFIENKFNNDASNWWIANKTAIDSLLRSAYLKVIDKPENGIYVCKPDNPPGKQVYEKLVFPKYGIKDGFICPYRE